MKQSITRSSEYLDFTRNRPCSFCAHPSTEPHHVFKQLRGISEAGMAQKGTDFLAIPVCHPCHEKLENGNLRPDRDDLFELIVINLISYLSPENLGTSSPRCEVAPEGRFVEAPQR